MMKPYGMLPGSAPQDEGYILMASYSFIPRGVRVQAFGVIILLLAASLMVASSRGELHPDIFSCLGLPGTGYPVAFLCDYSAGDSPIFQSPESAGRLDKADLPYLSPEGVMIDLIFYSALLLATWFVLSYGIHILRGGRRVDEI